MNQRSVLRAFAIACAVSSIVCAQSVRASAADAGKIRTYYVAADEVQWDYAPVRPRRSHGHGLRRHRQGLYRNRTAPDRPRLQEGHLSRIH